MLFFGQNEKRNFTTLSGLPSINYYSFEIETMSKIFKYYIF